MRAPASGNRLDDADAAIAKGMLNRGDRQHDIAAWFGVNGGRIGEISRGATFSHVKPQKKDLPPPGPYTSGKNVHEAMARLSDLRDQLSNIMSEIEHEIMKLSEVPERPDDE